VTIQLVLLLAYAIALVALGLWIGRRVESSGAFFVAGRSLGPGLLFATILAANIGAGSTVGAAGLGYRDGLSAWWWVGSAGIGTLVLGLWVGPKLWRVAAQRGLYTVGDYLEHRYGSSVRAVIAALLWVGSLAILAGQLIAVAWVLEVVAGTPRWGGILIGGAVMTAYFAAGGLLTSAWVNLVQLCVLMLGFAVAIPWALVSAGGWEAVVSSAPASNGFFNPLQGGDSGWMYLALLAPAFIVSPGLIQKVYGATDEKAVRLGVGAAGIALLVFAAGPPLLGMLAHVYAPGLENHELALPTVLMVGLPPLLGTLALAAVFSAEISSADAILFMLSTSLSKDLYKRFYRPEASDRDVLAVARRAAVAGGGLALVLGFTLPGVIDALTVFYSLLSVSLFVPVIAGIYARRAGTPEALAAIAAGVMGLVAARLMDLGSLSTLLDETLVGLAASAVAVLVVGTIRRGAPERTSRRR
jgi:SSS family solute:Na+ symporter